MVKSFFESGVPTNRFAAGDFFDRHENASQDELKQLQSEFEFLSPEDICDIETYLFSNSRCTGNLVGIICAGLPVMNNLDEESIGYLLYELFLRYVDGSRDEVASEKDLVKIIDGYWPDRPKPVMALLGACVESAFSRVDSPACNTPIESLSFEFDKSLADQFARSFEINDHYSSLALRSAKTFSILTLPQCLSTYINLLQANGELSLVNDLFQKICNGDGLNKKYLEVFSEKVGHDFLLSAIKDTCFSKSLESAKAISSIYGESAIFDDKQFNIFYSVISSGRFPMSYDMVISEKFDSKLFPRLTAQVLSDIDDLFRCQMSKATKEGISSFGIAHGAGSRVLAGELNRIGRSLTPVFGENVLNMSPSETVSLVVSHHHDPKGLFVEPYLQEIYEIVRKVGLENSHPVLSSVDGRFVAGYIEKFLTESSASEMRALMKMYPKCKGYVLENDLGL